MAKAKKKASKTSSVSLRDNKVKGSSRKKVARASAKGKKKGK